MDKIFIWILIIFSVAMLVKGWENPSCTDRELLIKLFNESYKCN